MASSYESLGVVDDEESSYRYQHRVGGGEEEEQGGDGDDTRAQRSGLYHPFVAMGALTVFAVVGATLARTAPESASSAASTSEFAEDDNDELLKVSLFDGFKSKYGGNLGTGYSDANEEKLRYGVFKDNIDVMRAANDANGHDEDGPYAIYGITQFSDMTAEEFKSAMLSERPEGTGMVDTLINGQPGTVSRFDGVCRSCVRFDSIDTETEGGSVLPEEFDWREPQYNGVVSAVQDQGYCGSCWTFGATGDIEGTWMIATGSAVSLSEQQLVSCDTKIDAGCNGGVQEYAFDYIIENGGIVSDDAYPYTSGDGKSRTCDASMASAENVVAKIEGWEIIADGGSPSDEEAIKEALVKSGPITIAVNADPEQFYVGGIDNPSNCDPSALDHAVLVVGYGQEMGVDYWTIKNSWGDAWGEAGYYRLLRGGNVCGVAMDAVHSLIDTPVVNNNHE